MVDLSAIAKWPNVPACYEWLSLDRRGNWRLQGERVTHRGLIEFMNRQYGVDDRGAWFVQNGPQRVFVDLAATPWVFHQHGDEFLAHTGQPVGAIDYLLIDESGNFYMKTSLGIGLLDDRDLPALAADCTAPNGTLAVEEDFLAAIEGASQVIFWRGLEIRPIIAASLAAEFGFLPQPRP